VSGFLLYADLCLVAPFAERPSPQLFRHRHIRQRLFERISAVVLMASIGRLATRRASMLSRFIFKGYAALIVVGDMIRAMNGRTHVNLVVQDARTTKPPPGGF
jgi:hypothetical protein